MKITRREFAKLVGAASLGTAGSARANEYFPGWPDRYAMLTDTTICIGSNCRKCEEACKKTNNLPPHEKPLSDDSVFDQRRRTDPENFTVVNRFENNADPEKPIFVKKQCMHCNEPACASACLVKAFTKTPEGPVIYNKDVCIGCRYCMVACPFYIPTYDYFDAFEPQVRKCTMCYDRIKEGKIPACAEICPKEAIIFGKRDELIELAHSKIRNHPENYVNHVFGEHEAGGTGWLYLAGVGFEDIGMPGDLGDKPYPEYTRGFLSAVPLVLTIWPVMLIGFKKMTERKDKVSEEKSLKGEG